MREGSLYVGVIGIRIVEYYMLGLVSEEKVEKECKDESEEDGSRDKNDHEFLVSLFFLSFLPLLFNGLRIIRVVLIYKDFKM